MTAPKAYIRLVWTIAVWLAIPGSPAFSQNDIEDPNHYEGSWYRIVLDSDSQYLRGDGHGYNGGTWYHYPNTGWYRQWFYNQPYDPDRRGYLRYEVYIKAMDPSLQTYVEVNFNWATPDWHHLGRSRPPLPADTPTAEDEARYMQSKRIYVVDNWFIGTLEPIATLVIEDYNPAWVSIDVRGRNAYIYRGAMRECRSKEGACCNPINENCFLSEEQDCQAPYQWLGPETTCDQCRQDLPWADFGDAPDADYRTLAGSDGARHSIVDGVYLGQAVDGELDAKPDVKAQGDDLRNSDDEDGVTFTSPLAPGLSATVEVTASVQGYLNAWVDFNRNASFGDAGEHVFVDVLVASGLNTLSVEVPPSATPGKTFARFRFDTRGLLSWYGPAADGEIEDYQVEIATLLEPQSNSGKGGLAWNQRPQQFDAATPYIFNGWGEPSALHLRRIAADDWRCEDDRPITGFQWWGAFEGWAQPMLPPQKPLAFHIAVWTDATEPGATGATGPSHPGRLIWETFCTNWIWNLAGYHSDPRAIHDDACFQFTCLLSQDQWFTRATGTGATDTQETAVRWLSIAAVYDTTVAIPTHSWAWTTRPHFFNAGALRIEHTDTTNAHDTSWPPGLGSSWLDGSLVEHPPSVAWDLAFELLTNRDSELWDEGLAPVYRFWSETIGGHFYTIDEAEKNRLINEFPHVWTYENVAFYAYPPNHRPIGSKPVYRFSSKATGRQFYSIGESEKQRLIDTQADIWTFEGIAWYAFD